MQPLFNSYLLRNLVRERTAAIETEVQSLPANTLLNAPESELAGALSEKIRLDVPTIDEAAIHVAETSETQCTVAVPFTGDPYLFRVKPPTHFPQPPLAEIQSSRLLLHFPPAKT